MMKDFFQYLPLGPNLMGILQLLPMTPPALCKMSAHGIHPAASGLQEPDDFRPDECLFFFNRSYKQAISRSRERYKNNLSLLVRESGASIHELLDRDFKLLGLFRRRFPHCVKIHDETADLRRSAVGILKTENAQFPDIESPMDLIADKVAADPLVCFLGQSLAVNLKLFFRFLFPFEHLLRRNRRSKFRHKKPVNNGEIPFEGL